MDGCSAGPRGPSDCFPVLLCPGAATSRWLGFGADAAEALRVRLVSVDRPALGASTPAPGRMFGDFADDIRHLAALRGLGRPAVSGTHRAHRTRSRAPWKGSPVHWPSCPARMPIWRCPGCRVRHGAMLTARIPGARRHIVPGIGGQCCGPTLSRFSVCHCHTEKTAPQQSHQGPSGTSRQVPWRFRSSCSKSSASRSCFSAVACASAAFSSWSPLCCCAWPSLRR